MNEAKADPRTMNDLTGRAVLVTAGSRGIGRAIVLALAEAGADVVLHYISEERRDDALATAAEITEMGRRVIALQAELIDAEAVAAMVREGEKAFGRIDILVHNGAITAPAYEPVALSDEQIVRRAEGHLRSAYVCMQAVLPGMRSRRWGRIVNVAASGAQRDASRAGIEGLARAYATNLSRDGITVNVVAPSLAVEPAQQRVELARNNAPGRLGTPDEVAQAVLMTIGNAYMTGQVIHTALAGQASVAGATSGGALRR